MFGWMGKILFLNLTAGNVKEERLDSRVLKDFIGGRGLGTYYLNKFVDSKCDPLSPDNLLVMATGPLTGTGAPTGARYMVMTKSPLTGAITCSNSGGVFPTELKRTGYDAIIFSGRSGVGAVMGSKNLKAVAVKGKGRIPLADPERFKAFNKEILDIFKQGIEKTPLGLTINGTAGVVVATQNFGVLPTKNWQQGTFDGWEKIQGEELTRRFLVKNSACNGCPIGCGRKTEVDLPGFAGEGEGPEYETIYAMGSNCMVDNLAAITKANYICNEMGMDTITMGATIACAMELVDRGYLSEEEIGRSLKWGDAEALVELTRMTGSREGFGDLLAEGSYRLAERFGHSELAPVSKKQEFPGYEPRGAQAMGLAYATSPIGGSYMRGDPAYFELFSVPESMDPQQWEGKAKVTKAYQEVVF